VVDRALVTGGGGGIGAAIASALVARGVDVVVADVEEQRCEEVARRIGATPHVLDVTSSAQVAGAMAALAQDGPVSILVNAAGIPGREALARRAAAYERAEAEALPAPRFDATIGLTDEEWRSMLATHLDGTFHCVRAVLPSMMAANGGAIVNVSSVCGLQGCAGSPHYSAAKGAVIAFTKAVAKDVAAYGITVNAVAPGYVEGPMADLMPPLMREHVIGSTPAGRLGSPNEVAAAVCYAALDAGSFLTGQVLSPNGGLWT
jgi:3-oxoacyl-[acyl-carrier protein] reductase